MMENSCPGPKPVRFERPSSVAETGVENVSATGISRLRFSAGSNLHSKRTEAIE
jgi:hypothetical protein